MAELHEQFHRGHERVEHASNRRFGVVIGAIVFAIGAIRAYVLGSFGTFDVTLSVIGIALVIAGIVVPKMLQPLNRAWSALGLVLHKMLNPVVLGIMFVVAIIPTGLIMRALRVDPMTRRFSSSEEYWQKRTRPSSTSESLK